MRDVAAKPCVRRTGEPDPLFSLSVNNIVTIRLCRLSKTGGVKTRVVKVRPITSEVQR